MNYGTLLYRSGRKSEALEEYRAAAALEPEKPEISYNLALVLKDLGDYEEALGLMFNAHPKGAGTGGICSGDDGNADRAGGESMPNWH